MNIKKNHRVSNNYIDNRKLKSHIKYKSRFTSENLNNKETLKCLWMLMRKRKILSNFF